MEFNLSEKRLKRHDSGWDYDEEDVKEFITEIRKFLAERTELVRQPENVKLITFQPFEFEDFLEEFAGEKLISMKKEERK